MFNFVDEWQYSTLLLLYNTHLNLSFEKWYISIFHVYNRLYRYYDTDGTNYTTPSYMAPRLGFFLPDKDFYTHAEMK